MDGQTSAPATEATALQSRGADPIHLEPYFVSRRGTVSLPVTEDVAARSVWLPLFRDMTDLEQEYVIEKLRAALGA